MAFEHIYRMRTITKGPGAKDWADATTVSNLPVHLFVRGLWSKCDCSRGGECSDCDHSTGVFMQIVGVFNPDLDQRGFVYWGIIAERVNYLLNIQDIPLPSNERVRPRPMSSHLVYGWYTPFPKKGIRGWMAPCVEGQTLEELFTLFYNTPKLSRTLKTHGDQLAEQSLGKILSPVTLLQMFQEGTPLTLRLHLHSGLQNSVGEAEIHFSSVEREHGNLCFRAMLFFRHENGHESSYPDVKLKVDKDGGWGSIISQRNNGRQVFVLA